MVEDEVFVFVLLLLFGGLGDGERRLASRRGDCGEVREGVALVLVEFVIVFFVVIGGGGSSNGFVVVELTGKANGLVDDEAVVEVAVLAPLGVLVGVG